MVLLFRLSSVAVALAIIYLSLTPNVETSGPEHADKVNHFIAYGVLTGCVGLGWPKLRSLFLVGAVFMFGIGLELAQGLGGYGRTASALDALANLTGAVAAGLFFFILRKK
ncbi:MAG: hypothetical protein AAFP97_03090 [Pseudomonadota bacterium]